MYQFYYAKKKKIENSNWTDKLVQQIYEPEMARVTMWEEHCLECAAPLCFGECPHYEARTDGRCKRMENGIEIKKLPDANGGYSAHVKFRKWGNMMSVIYPAILKPEQMEKLQRFQIRQGKVIRFVLDLKLPISLRWTFTRCVEYAFRYRLKKKKTESIEPEAFYLHAVSYEREPFSLIMEIFQNERGIFRQAFRMQPGENAFVVPVEELSRDCFKTGNLIKLYPENNREAEVEFIWCDFVTGHSVVAASERKPAEKVKCLVWDLDHTLWDGILIEKDGKETLTLRAGVQKTIEELDQRGILHSIASKNDEEPVREELDRLGISDYFLFPQIGWGAKSDSIRKIAKQLNIGLDTFAFIDDSEFERQQVQRELPEVRIMDVSEIGNILKDPAFDVPVTEESRQRRKMYQAEVKRNEVKLEQGADIEKFIESCQIKVEMFAPQGEQEKLRCFELVQRTNQLNASGIKYNREKFEEILSGSRGECYAFSCKDIYGSYGIVGFLCCRMKDDVLEVTEFAMSCRVAGKYVESAVFAWLLEQYNAKQGMFKVVKTAKNSLLRRSLDEIGFQKDQDVEKDVLYRYKRDLKNRGLVKIMKRIN